MHVTDQPTVETFLDQQKEVNTGEVCKVITNPPPYVNTPVVGFQRSIQRVLGKDHLRDARGGVDTQPHT